MNVEGLKRRGFSAPRIRVLKEAYRVLYRMDLTLTDALQRLQELERDSEDVMQLRAFVAARQRSIVH